MMNKVAWILKGGEAVNRWMQWDWLGQNSYPCVGEPRVSNQCGNGIATTVNKVGEGICTCAQRGKHQGSAQWPSTQRTAACWASGRTITLKAAVNIWAENLYLWRNLYSCPRSEIIKSQLGWWFPFWLQFLCVQMSKWRGLCTCTSAGVLAFPLGILFVQRLP